MTVRLKGKTPIGYGNVEAIGPKGPVYRFGVDGRALAKKASHARHGLQRGQIIAGPAINVALH